MALPATTVWEVRSTGSDSNGGGYDPSNGGSGSTDYSQQNAAQYSGGSYSASGTTTLTDANAGFTAAMAGNNINLSGQGIYNIVTWVDSSHVTVDRALGTFSGVGGSVGGAFATISQGISSMVAQNILWLKNGTYTITATLTPPAGANDKLTRVIGYNATRGDVTGPTTNMPTIQISSGSFHVFTVNTSHVALQNLILDANNAAASNCINQSGTNRGFFDNIEAKNFKNIGIAINGGANTVSRCWVHSNGTGALFGFDIAGDGIVLQSGASGLTCTGMRANVSGTVAHTIIANNSGASSDGVLVNTSNVNLLNMVIWNNGRDGVRLNGAGTSDGTTIRNSIVEKNGGFGINNQTGTTTLFTPLADYNIFWSNTSGARNNFPAGANDQTGTADPFSSSAGSVTTLADLFANFALNTGAADFASLIKGKGSPAYLDIGAVQHQDAGGGGTTNIVPIPRRMVIVRPAYYRPIRAMISGGTTTTITNVMAQRRQVVIAQRPYVRRIMPYISAPAPTGTFALRQVRPMIVRPTYRITLRPSIVATTAPPTNFFAKPKRIMSLRSSPAIQRRVAFIVSTAAPVTVVLPPRRTIVARVNQQPIRRPLIPPQPNITQTVLVQRRQMVM